MPPKKQQNAAPVEATKQATPPVAKKPEQPKEKAPEQKAEVKKTEAKKTEPKQENDSKPKQETRKDSPIPPTNNKSNTIPKKVQKDVPFILPEDKKALADLEHKREAAEKEIEKLSKQIDDALEKKNALYESEDECFRLSKDSQRKISRINEKIKEINEQSANEEKTKKAKQDELANHKKIIEEKWGVYFKQPMDANRGPNLGKIDGRVKGLEQKMASTAMPINEEKRTVTEINALTNLKKAVKEYFEKERNTNDDYQKTKTEERIKGLEEKIAALQAGDKEAQENLAAAKKLYQDNEDILNEKTTKRKALKKEIFEGDKEWRVVQEKITVQKEKWVKEREEERKKFQEEKEKQRLEREAAREKRNLDRATSEAKIPPFKEELRAVDKLISKLNEYLKAAEKEKEKEKFLKKDAKLSLELLVLYERLSMVPPAKIENFVTGIEDLKKKKEFLLELRKQVTPPGVVYEEETPEEEKEEKVTEEEEEDSVSDEKKEEKAEEEAVETKTEQE